MTAVSDEDISPQDKTNAAMAHVTALGKTSTTQADSDHAKDADLQDTDETHLVSSDGAEEPKAVEEEQNTVKSDVGEHDSQGESTMNGNVVRYEEALPDPPPVDEPVALSPVLSTGHAGIPWAELGAKIQTPEPSSDDDLRVSENLAQDFFIPNMEGENMDHILPFFTKRPASLSSEEHSQDSTLLSKSKNAGKGTSAVEVVEEPGQGPSTDATVPPTPAAAEMPVLQNLEVPDMSWASDSPVAFTSSAPNSYVDKKIDELRARAEAAFLRRQILRRHVAQREQQVQREAAKSPAAPPAPPRQEKENMEVVKKSGKISNRKKQRQAAKAKREASLESSVTAVVTPNPPGPSSAIVTTQPIESKHTDEENHNSMDDEFKVETRPSKRAQRAKAFAESQEKKARELKASQELKKLQEEEAAAERATAPVLTAAAKRRNRQKRNNAGKSYADALKI